MQEKTTLKLNSSAYEKYEYGHLGRWYKSSNQRCSVKKGVLAQVFSCEFCVISKNIFFTQQFRTTASVGTVN